MASDYCYGEEMIQAMKRHEQGKARVIPVKLRPVDWRDAPFAKLKALPTSDKPVVVSDGHTIDEAFFDVAKGIREALEELLIKPATITDGGQEKVSTPSSFLPDENYLPPAPKKRPRSARERPSSQPSSSSAQQSTEASESLVVADSSVYVKYVCPNCSERCYLGDCTIVSRVNEGMILQPPPHEESQQHYARIHPEPLISSRHIKEMACRSCYNCEFLLPYNIERVNNMRIAVIGDIFSGKSHYIASLVHELQEGHMQEMIRFSAIDDQVTHKYINEYYGPLFLSKHILPRTLPGDAPARDTFRLGTGIERKSLMYDLVIESAASHLTKRVNLMIYDASGEDYISQDRIVKFCQYLFSADAIIFLIDPLTLPGIIAQLPLNFLASLPPYYQV